MQPTVSPFFHAPTSTWTYVVADPGSRAAVIIDPVLDYDWRSGRTGTASANHVVAHCTQARLRVAWILETHAHADHLSGVPYFRERYRSKTVIGWKLPQIQKLWAKLLHLGADFPVDGRQWDVLLEDGQSLDVGPFAIEAISTPGHTPACVTYRIGDALFVGDTVFMPDSGSARCDFPGGDARALYRSVRRLYELPAETRVFVCHDYSPGGRPARCETTIAEQKAANTHIRDGVSEDEYVAMRSARDATLDVPNLLIPAVQVNIRAGHLPPPERDGVRYLRVPLDVLGRPG